MSHTESKHISNISSCDTKQLFYFLSKMWQLDAKIGTTASKSLQTCCWVRKISGLSYSTFSTIYNRSINIWLLLVIGTIGNHSHVKWHLSSHKYLSASTPIGNDWNVTPAWHTNYRPFASKMHGQMLKFGVCILFHPSKLLSHYWLWLLKWKTHKK